MKKGLYRIEIGSLLNEVGNFAFQVKSNLTPDVIMQKNDQLHFQASLDTTQVIQLSDELNQIYIDANTILYNTTVGTQKAEIFSNFFEVNEKLKLYTNKVVNFKVYDIQGNILQENNAQSFEFTSLLGQDYFFAITSIENLNFNIFTDANIDNESDEPVEVKLTKLYQYKNSSNNNDVGSTIATARPLNLYNNRDTELKVVLGDNTDSKGDVDVYKIAVHQGDQIYVSTPNGISIDGYLKVYDAQGNLVASTDDYPLSYTFNTSGSFYLAFHSYGNRNSYNVNTGENNSNYYSGELNLTIKLTSDQKQIYVIDQNRSLTSKSQDFIYHKLSFPISWYLTDEAGHISSQGNNSFINLKNAKFLWMVPNIDERNKVEYELIDADQNNVTKTSEFTLNQTEALKLSFKDYKNISQVINNIHVEVSGLYFINVDTPQYATDIKIVGKNLQVDLFRNQPAHTQLIYLEKGLYQLVSYKNLIEDVEQSIQIYSEKLNKNLSLNEAQKISIAKSSSQVFDLKVHEKTEYTFEFDRALTANDKVTVWDGAGNILATSMTDTTSIVFSTNYQKTVFVEMFNATLVERDFTFKISDNLISPVSNIVAQAANTNEIVTVNTGQIIEHQAYEFIVNLSDNYLITLNNPSFAYGKLIHLEQGTVFEGELNGAVIFKWLVEGKYRFEFSDIKQTSAFTFNISNKAIDLQENIVQKVDFSNKTVFLYQLNENKNYFIKAQNATNWDGLNYVLYDASGQVIQSNPLNENILNLILNEYSEKHYIVIYSANENFLLNNFEFLLESASSEIKKINLNENVLVSFHKDNQVNQFQFDVIDATHIDFTMNQMDYNYKLFDQNGDEVTQQLNWYSSNKAYFLHSGQYTLVITNIQPIFTEIRQSSFKVSSTKPIDILSEAQDITISYLNSVADKILQLNLIAGQEYDLLASYSYSYSNYENYTWSSKLKYYLYNQDGVLIYTSTGHKGASFKAKETGQYYLVTSGSEISSSTNWSLGGYNNTVTFSLKPKQTFNAYTMGDSVSDFVNYVDNNQKVYRFTLDEKTQINFSTLGYGIGFRLKPTFSTMELWSVNSSGNSANQILTLEAGSYDFIVTNNFDYPNASREFNFTLTELNEAIDLPLDQTVSHTVNQSIQTSIWKITGKAGQNWVIDVRNITQNLYQTTVWNLYDDRGNNIRSSSQYYNYDNAIKINLKKDGVYYLVLQGSELSKQKQSRTSTINVSIAETILQPVKLNQTISGTLSKAGDVHKYKLHLEEAQTVILDAAFGNVNYAYLTNAQGKQQYISLSSNQYQIVRLSAGDHQFEFYSDRTNLGDYQLKILSLLSTTQEIHHTELLNEKLSVNQKLAIYTLNTEVGKKYNINFINTDNLSYSIVDEAGNVVVPITYTPYYSAPSFISHATKLYLVVKRTDNSQTEKQISANIQPVENTIQTLFLQKDILGTLFTSDSTHSFQFKIEQDGWLNLKNLKLSQSSMYLKLFTPNNNLISQYDNLTAIQSAKVYLNAGIYRLEVSANTDNNANYQFYADFIANDNSGSVSTSIKDAKELFISDNLNLVVNQPSSTDHYYRLMLNQEDQLDVRLDNSQIRLLNKDGTELAVLEQQGRFSIATTDIYYLKVTSDHALEQANLYLARQSSKIAVPIAIDAGDTLATAQEVFVAEGTLYTLETEIGDGINTNKDIDLYQLMLTAGDQLEVRKYTNSSYLTRVFDANGEELYRTNYGGDGYYSYTVNKTGVYYIGLSGGSNSNYNPIDSSSLATSVTGSNSIQISRRIGALKPLVNYVLPKIIPTTINSEETWKEVITNSVNNLDLFYFQVKDAGLYYLDGNVLNWQAYYSSRTIQVINLQNRQQILSNNNSLVYLNAGNYVVQGKRQNAYYSNPIEGFKWINIDQSKTIIEFGQSVTTTDTQLNQANNIYEFIAPKDGYIKFNALGYNGRSPWYKIYNQYGQLITEVDQNANLDSNSIYLSSAGKYYLIFDVDSKYYDADVNAYSE